MSSNTYSTLITGLLTKGSFGHSTQKLELIETHISWVILTGEYVYKIKKPVNLGFLDFSTLVNRHHYCNEELRINSRLAPQLYLAVVTITGTIEKPVINGAGDALEYAVKMKQFPQDVQLDRMLLNDKLSELHIDALANSVAEFHLKCDISNELSEYGTPKILFAPVVENFLQIAQQQNFNFDANKLDQLQQWSKDFFHLNEARFSKRKSNNFIRECHGDMHLGNIAFWNKEILIFDGLEFDKKLRWIDVISEIAFIVMDLEHRDQYKFARRFLNLYLEITGDYDGVTLLDFYLVYRAMVRAKVSCIQAQQQSKNKILQQQLTQNYNDHINLALSYIEQKQPSLIITHGFSGSGKTILSQTILEQVAIIRLRSDVERKRLFGLDIMSNSNSTTNDNIYSSNATEKTHQRLFKLASAILNKGRSVIIDATFLSREYRQQASELAKQNKAHFYILDCQVSEKILLQRIAKRIQLNNDASEANKTVLENQLLHHDSLTDKELAYTTKINTGEELENSELLSQFIADLI